MDTIDTIHKINKMSSITYSVALSSSVIIYFLRIYPFVVKLRHFPDIAITRTLSLI